jgi:propionyl-CoA carboxylase alpha chain
LISSIDNYEIEGVSTTLSFGKFVMEHEAFRSGDFDTNFVKKYYSEEKVKELSKAEASVAARIALQLYLEEKEKLVLPEN